MSRQELSASSDRSSKLKERWEEAFEISQRMSGRTALTDGTFSYLHTKKHVHVYSSHEPIEWKRTASSTQLSESHVWTVRGDVRIEQSTGEEYMQPFISLDMDVKKVLDPLTKRNDNIETWVDEDGGTYHVQYFSIGIGAPLISDRDFLYILRVVKSSPELSYVIATSVDDIYNDPPSDFKPQKGAVRGTNVFICQRYEQLSNGDLDVCYSTLSKPNGWLPTYLVNMALDAQVLKLTEIARLANKKVKPSVPPHQE